MSTLTRRRLLQLGLGTTGALSLLAVAGTACAPPAGSDDAGDTNDQDAGETVADAGDETPDAGETTPDAGETTPDAGEEPVDACNGGAPATSITVNHGHVCMISHELLTNGQTSEIDITGNAGHVHTIVLTPSQKQLVLSGSPVIITSTSSGHSHDVTITCVA